MLSDARIGPVPSRVLAIFAHPDDDVFGFAGTAMKLMEAGHDVALATVTRGDRGRWWRRKLGTWSRASLAAERAREWRASCRVIGYGRSWLLRWPDGGVAEADDDAITRQLVRIIRDFRPATVVTFGPEGAGSEHPDHAGTSRLAARAFRWAADAAAPPRRARPHAARRLYFTTAPEDARGLRGRRPAGYLSPTHVMDVRSYLERKAEAFECHRTQFKDRPFFYEFLRLRGGREYFHLAADRQTRPRTASLV
jgi:LmbE family N-acetylglucosaminyl deacetylase